MFYFRYLAARLFRHALEILHFPGTFIQSGLFLFQIFHTSLGCVLHFYLSGIFYSEHLAAKLFVHILRMLWKFCIFPGHLCEHQACFFQIFHTSPGHVFTFVHVSGMFYFRHLASKLFMCPHVLQMVDLMFWDFN